MTVRRPPLWLLLPAVPLAVGAAAVAWWAPYAFLFASPWLAGIAWFRLHGTKITDGMQPGYFERARRRL